MKLFFLLVILFSTLLQAYNIDQILDLYRKESDLSKKTKNESLGHLTVYTRDDIERMQAHNLSELLNSLRSFRYDENLFGMPDVLHADPATYASDIVKIFINNHEITSAFAGSGLFIYGNIDLGFVDHVEVYEGSTSSSVNSEPSVVTIKLYSKDPAREVGTNIQAYAGSRGTHHENISYAAASDDLKYYAYASHSKVERTDYTHDTYDLSRDYQNKHALMTVNYKNVKVGAEYIDHKMDPFLSLSMFATPKNGDIDYKLKRVSATSTFLNDDSLKLSLSFIRINEYLNLNMDRTRWTTNPAKLLLPQDSLHSNSIDDVYNVKVDKKFAYKANNFIIGSEYIKKSLHDTVAYNNGILESNPTFVDNSIFSLYIQDDYILTESQMLTASIKQNYYHSKSNATQRNFDTFQARLGYIVTSKGSTFKAFASQMQLPTEQYALSSAANAAIEVLRIRDVSAEYNKNIANHTIGACLEYIQNENSRITISQGAPKYYNNYSASVKYDYKFDAFNNLKSMLYANRYHDPATTEDKRVNGAFVRFLNTWRKFDFYNEADYYRVKKTPINGINYNVGIRYKPTASLIFSVKGTNIFNSAAKSRYSYIKMNGFVPEQKSLYIFPIDQTFTVGMEYSF
ncbi:TonB-dependent receptor plug domain-containing protein [Sulfurimonas paralvinellae]|uniref:TonB-dependent receptor plug domain-containing protein n=1 Tax=Sulfurimonas paralvinellae TaxID=317658 RepID=A0A7M1BCD7_9BACT|nr:TonB-dependent receptor plug domain-containing protein [Sulfurimonas paralvinellae]QOP46478.1 hypothetical protein FM071_09300 [Sulfurimonas paralvinellae]